MLGVREEDVRGGSVTSEQRAGGHLFKPLRKAPGRSHGFGRERGSAPAPEWQLDGRLGFALDEGATALSPRF
jgi:hypothetical protein